MSHIGFLANRELKRVPMGFYWKLHEPWWGYRASCYSECEGDCPICSMDKIDPPEGEGYQCWETCSEGSPISPVFLTLDGLLDWLMANPKGVTENLTREEWKRMLTDNYGIIDMATKHLEPPVKKG